MQKLKNIDLVYDIIYFVLTSLEWETKL